MPDIAFPPFSALLATRSVYTSGNSDAIVTGANVRSSMLPANALTGNTFFTLPPNSLPIGAHFLMLGAGTIGARTAATPGFNFIPWVTPAGGSKTDLPGFSYAPLLGTDGTCEVWMLLSQLAGGLRVAGYVRYGAANGQAYSIPLNGGATGAAGALPTIVTSDPTVSRDVGVDGFWGSGADAREYVKCRAIAGLVIPAI